MIRFDNFADLLSLFDFYFLLGNTEPDFLADRDFLIRMNYQCEIAAFYLKLKIVAFIFEGFDFSLENICLVFLPAGLLRLRGSLSS